MNKNQPLIFLFKATVAGLAIAFVILLLRPDLLGQKRPVVEILQSQTTANGPNSGPVSYAAAVEAAAPAVANIYTTKIITERVNPFFNNPFFREFFGDQLAPRQRLENSLGSGVIISKEGYVLTNNHVVEGAAGIEVALRDGRSAEARLVGTDPESDLAVLKIELQDVPTITFRGKKALRVGDVVLAIGNPFGVGQTVTMGIVSATGRDRVGINTYENFIQTDAAINPGNSGGALIDAMGKLVGINTAIFSKSGGSQGIGFAIPASIVKDIMGQIIESGHVSRGWLGIEGQDISPQLAESFNLKDVKGVIVAGIQRSGPAAKAGMRAGDIIIEVNGEKIADRRTVMDLIAQIKPGEKLTVKVLRAGKIIKLKATVGERPRANSYSGQRG
jgi:serine protease DegS